MVASAPEIGYHTDTMSDFVHLHVHSHYSLLNGLTKVKDLVKTAKKRGFTAIALTDYGALYGAIEFYRACLENEIKPIIGFEAAIAPRLHTDKDPEKDKEIHSLVLLAQNYDGYRNLMKLSSIGQVDGLFLDTARIDKTLLKEYGNNIIALSGSMDGEIPSLLHKGHYDKALQVAKEYNTLFGQDNFYLELQDHPAKEGQLAVNTQLMQLSKETGIPVVATRDVHYLNPEQADAQDIMRCISEGWKVHYTDREDYRHIDRSLNTAEDISSRFRHIPEAIQNTRRIADRIQIDIKLDDWHFAPVPLDPGKTYDEMLRDNAFLAAPSFYPDMGEEVVTRLNYELDIIKTKKYSPYFLCVADFVRYAKEQGIVESTRGSAAGSLVSYVLGVTTVDPLRFKLPFERFLNPFRPSAPDIDTDFADDRRQDMIEYVTKKYGVDKVAQIITFGTMQARAAVRDVGRALGFSYNFCDQVAKLIPPGAQGFPMTIDRALQEEPDLKKLYDTNPDVSRLLTLAKQVEGCARHTSIHAAGVVISPTPLTDYTPIQREVGGDKIVTQYEMKSVEAAGVLKNDFLGIRNLSILGNAVNIVKKTTGDDVDIYHLPLDDQKVYAMLARGETMGVFQMGGSGMTRWLKELKPNRIEDIMAMVALYRPGPMESIPEYIRRKYNPALVEYPDPRLEKILEASYGLLVYQDDVMLTAIELAGYDWMEADKFRKAMGKKIPEEMAKQKIQFYQGCKTHGKLKQETIDALWRAIEPFAAYGFNKAHAASYGIVAYQTAYMKAHYPVQFMTAVLQAESGDNDKVAAIVAECRRMHIDVRPPDVNESFKSFAMTSAQGEPGVIRFGLMAIKNVGEHICETIYRERKQGGAFTSLENFLERIQDKDMNKRSLEHLIKSGALDCFSEDRGVLLSNLEHLLFFNKQVKEASTSNQGSLFAGTSMALDHKVVLKPAATATLEEKLLWEKEFLGIYVSSHPCLPFEKRLKQVITFLQDIESSPRDSWVVVMGVVDSIKKKITKKGSIMLFVTIQDTTSAMELLIFPKVYEKTQSIWHEGSIVCVVGKTPKEEGDNKIFAENVHPINKESIDRVASQLLLGQGTLSTKQASSRASTSKEITAVILTLSTSELTQYEAALKQLFSEHGGTCEVRIRVGNTLMRLPTGVLWQPVLKEALVALIGLNNIEEVQS